ncbi:MAG: hypothetical protein DMF10_02830 [Verrucomicrobia bacterium]|nr:MAG: hypothetical protein DMF10_02830 [Verrucomicrobiota bacterium]
MNLPSVHIVVLNWNGKPDTLECLTSLQSVSYPNRKIVVVDNGSTDGSEEAIKAAFPDVTFIQTGENLGYAEGNNVGIHHAMECGADFVFVLNNDTTTDTDVVTALVAQAEKNPNAAILGPKIYFYERPDIINSAGGHLVLRLSVLREVGFFDRDFFLICEELDLCTRIRKRGFEILFVPEAKLWHKVSAAFDGNFSAVYCYYFFRNSLLYVWKNFPDRRFVLYWKVFGDSREFYHRLKRSGDAGYRRKGFCILMGVIHFFTGVRGKAPEWVFKIKFSREAICRGNRGSREHRSIPVGDKH